MPSFSSVTTNAARMQEISLNPQKLAGQCSKLKCCLMYEYDAYADARRTIPRLREPLQTLDGEYHLIKIDPLAGTMSFSTSKNTIANLTTLTTERVKAIIAMNRAGEKPESLIGEEDERPAAEPTYRSEEDSIDRFDNKGRRNKRNKRNKGHNKHNNEQSAPKEGSNETTEATPAKEGNEGGNENRERRERPRRHDRNENRVRAEKPERAERPERTEKPERTEEGGETTERGERGERNNRNNRGRNRGRHNHRQEGRRPKEGNNNSGSENQ